MDFVIFWKYILYYLKEQNQCLSINKKFRILVVIKLTMGEAVPNLKKHFTFIINVYVSCVYEYYMKFMFVFLLEMVKCPWNSFHSNICNIYTSTAFLAYSSHHQRRCGADYQINNPEVLFLFLVLHSVDRSANVAVLVSR